MVEVGGRRRVWEVQGGLVCDVTGKESTDRPCMTENGIFRTRDL